MVAVHQPKDRSSSSQKWEEELEELQQKRKLENILLLCFRLSPEVASSNQRLFLALEISTGYITYKHCNSAKLS